MKLTVFLAALVVVLSGCNQELPTPVESVGPRDTFRLDGQTVKDRYGRYFVMKYIGSDSYTPTLISTNDNLKGEW